MPPKKRVSKLREKVAEEIRAEMQEAGKKMIELVDELAESKLCNHRNLHTTDETACTLPKGHDGDHSDGKSAWSDAAGTPPRKHA